MEFPFHLNKKHPCEISQCFCLFRTFITITSQTLASLNIISSGPVIVVAPCVTSESETTRNSFPALCLHPLLIRLLNFPLHHQIRPGVPIHVFETQRPFDFPPRLDVLRSPSSHYWRRMEKESKKHKK